MTTITTSRSTMAGSGVFATALAKYPGEVLSTAVCPIAGEIRHTVADRAHNACSFAPLIGRGRKGTTARAVERAHWAAVNAWGGAA
jgi:hypothetical protein